MMNWIIKFEIDNNQEEYSACLQIIDIIENKRNMEPGDIALLKKVKYKYSSRELTFSDIAKGDFASCTDALPVLGENDSCRYYFQVNSTETDDIINLVYYCLINDRIGGKGILSIKCQNNQVEKNIRDLISDILTTGVIKQYYILINEKFTRINSIKTRRIKRFSPIFRISEESHSQESVSYWRKTVQTFCMELYQKTSGWGEGSKYTVNYFLPHIAPLYLKEEYSEDSWGDEDDRNYYREKQLINSCVECFCCKENNNRKPFVKHRYEWWKSKKFFEMIKHMPILAMYIFCLSDYYQKDVNNDSWDNIEQEIFDARDMAEGLLQILENIYHSEYQTGYFCFRIHSNTSSRSGQYLNKEYLEYMESQSINGGKGKNYLEMKVVDFSHRTIAMQFCERFSNRMNKADAANKVVYEKIMLQAGQLKLSSFYDENTEFWQQYNSLWDNVIHHYGIQIFQSLIACYQGYFRVRSQSDYVTKPDTDFYSIIENSGKCSNGIPGTQYDVLIPLGRQDMLQNISMDVNLKYDNYLMKDYDVCPSNIKFDADAIRDLLETEVGTISFQDKKELSIRSFEKQIEVSVEEHMVKVAMQDANLAEKSDKKCILHFSAKDIRITVVEIFCKALMLYIAKKGQDRDCYIMITDCTQAHFVEITRMMALFYNKQGVNPLMGRTQIFMSGEEEEEEFLITGINLEKAVVGTEKLAFARNVHPNCLKSLRKCLKNHAMTEKASPNDVISIVPFDMIRYDENKRTLMECRLEKVLSEDVQSDKFGCKLADLHVRIGSKIHIRTFYEAELLFHYNYYTLRFAYWLYNELNADVRLKKDKPFMLVGYESYSEMLINELCNMFEMGMNSRPEYIIYEEGAVGKFRAQKDLSQYTDAQFVIIIPINSTTTTHIKVAGFLEKSIRNSSGYGAGYILNRENLLNYGIVLISSEDKNKYWKRCDDDKAIISTIDNKKLKYYVEVQCKWESPLKCKACFPESDSTKELPLVETNKESVVPMHAISIRRPRSYGKSSDIDGQELLRLKELSEILVYRHVERNGNHFNYYFCTEKLWENEKIKRNVEKWLKEQGEELFRENKYKVYDIIVAPLHYSNTVFVEEVNNYLFRNAALVLHFDADREFRMNVRTKYSSVQQLYDNLHVRNEKAIINFHYIDDTIVSGRTYHRMKSLIRSLITIQKHSEVEINIFKSIVLLVNRMSKSSMADYVDDLTYFLAYFNLGISSMRVNSDACILCKKYDEWSKLSEQASLNEVYTYWKEKSSKIACVPVEKLDLHSSGTAGCIERSERAARYMIASHKAKSLLDDICSYKEVSEIKDDIVKELFPQNVLSFPDEFIAMLKVLGRPFMTFRREEKEAVFQLMLIMLDVLLDESEPEGDGKLYYILKGIWANSATRVNIVNMLINRLAELESNFIIRKYNMMRILNFAGKYINGKAYKEFTSNYLNRIKQLLWQSNDFAKGLFLEYLLLYGQEYDTVTDIEMDMNGLIGSNRDASFRRKVYLENTKLANYSIEYLADCFWNITEYTKENVKETLNGNYYFDNFIQYLAFHKIVKMDGNERVESFISDDGFQKLVGMLRFELLYQRIFGRKKISGLEEGGEKREASDAKEIEEIGSNIQDKFAEMMDCLKAVGGALDGEIIVPYNKNNEYMDKNLKYIPLNLGTGKDIRELENDEQKLLDFMREEREFEGDTYAVCDRPGRGKWLLFKFYDTIETGGNHTMVIYMLFPFDTGNEGELLHTAKNILIFRRKIWNILNLSSDVLLHNLTDNLFYKQQMLKSRSVGHMEFPEYLQRFEYICRIITDDSYNSKRMTDKEIIRNYFEMVINSMIGFMNAQLLGGKGEEYADLYPIELKFIGFWKKYNYAITALSRVFGLRIPHEIADADQYFIRKIDGENSANPSLSVLLIMFLAVFQNISKHCERDAENQCDVSIYIEKTKFSDGERICLCIKNQISQGNEQRIENMIRAETYRVTNGISLAVIFDICRAYYPKTNYTDLFSTIKSKCKERSGNKWYFVVKLPILN